MEQVLVNLVVNARDAMKDGGTLTIETRNVDLDEAHASRSPHCRPGPYAILAVTDTGMGIDPKTQARIFDPFFTTKPTGQGTGLGLSIVYGIVKQSGGHVWVYSEVGVGSTFKIYLPRLQNHSQAALPRRPAAEQSGRGETVLVVEDEAGLRELVCRGLEESGYSVLDAGCAQEALVVAGKHTGTIDLLLTDIIMPGMLGTTLAEKMRQIRPGIRLLFISGYPDNAVVQHGFVAESAPFMEKPFTLDALARKVHEVLKMEPQAA
jgi:CheY-like chemotaxis protein